ncbi:methylmalonate-semialdehyde dehydrogenase [Frondihabitans sp. PAMC 28766]|uniref:CoA-acylating methylmalonate-semialdehyde dehydrogenase n=1 Tax=Frondihabitans sp. PAMC 28766 TaxID=1795630 RepID=UPI00078EF77B|nr:CoA-acylating methylmalonate-semialdehyde dehydrogenase [Frondihabitans sp. PAMC 28766]AMM20040.1 methylmalonate-semialdehyde dehydrogenase [Frondihabitans sp. PAMC 28766]
MTTTAPSTTSSSTEIPTITHWIDGKRVEGTSGRTSPVFDPALGIATKNVALASQEEIDTAIASAKAAFPKWRDLSITKRQQIMFKFRELVNERKGELAEILTAEHGKVISDSLGEIQRGLEVLELATGFPSIIKGDFSQQVSTGVDVYSTKSPLGVVGIISPFNFPVMVPMWFFPIAIAVGNTVVLKPSEKDPSSSIFLAELFKEAGLPDGVFTVLQGDKLAVDGLLNSPDVASISFVGSTPIAKYIYETASKNGKRVQALGGAKNHMLVLPDADMELVADSAINAGFGSAGERCMAISVLVAVGDVGDRVIPMIKERMSKLTIGDGRRNCDMGPLVTEVHRDKVASYVDIAIEDGAEVVVDGRGIEVDGAKDGFWFGPTLIDKVPLTSRVYTEEIFGPVLSIVRVDTYEEGVELINSGAFGNGTAIFTNDGGAARRFQNEIEVGMIGINVPIPVPVAYYSFGGFKDSIFGDSKAYGTQGFHFFTREKAITSRWSDPSHGGINLGFPQA